MKKNEFNVNEFLSNSTGENFKFDSAKIWYLKKQNKTKFDNKQEAYKFREKIRKQIDEKEFNLGFHNWLIEIGFHSENLQVPKYKDYLNNKVKPNKK
jgi:hypothetical protein